MKKKDNQTVRQQPLKQIPRQSSLECVEPKPVQFFYEHLKEGKKAKKLERETLATQERNKGLTKNEIKKLEAEELAEKKRDNQVARNAQRERYGATGSRYRR